jgi:hypothetical protein
MEALTGRIRKLIFCVLIAAVLFTQITACSKAGIQATDVLKNNAAHIAIVRETDKLGQLIPKSHDHPYEMSAGKMGSILASLTTSEKIFIKWNPRGRLLSEIEVKRIAAPMAQALAKADKNEWVSFEVSSRRQRLFFKTKMMTSGWAWVKDDRLHLVIGNFRFEDDHRENEPYRGDPRLYFSMESSRIDKGDFNAPPLVDKQQKHLRKEHLNWTVVDLRTFMPTPEKLEKPAPSMSLEERLGQLKQLFEKDLITPEDYELKRKEILSEL